MAEQAAAQKQSSRRLLWAGAAIALFLAAVGGGAFVLLPLIYQNSDDVIYLAAEPEPFRVKPADTGGLEIANQDSSFLGYLADGDNKSAASEVISLTDEAPEPPPVQLGQDRQDGISPAVPKIKKSDDIQTVTATEIAPGTPLATASPAEGGAAARTRQSLRQDAQAPVPADKEAPNKEAPDKEPVAEKNNGKVKAEKPAAATAPASDPAFQVQLAAFTNDKKADTAAALLSEKHKSRLDGLQLEAMRVKKSDGSVFFRIVTPAIGADRAAGLCDRLKRAGQDCFLRKADRAQQ